MAKEAYDKYPLLLGDGTEVVLIPLNISRLKRFMTAFAAMREIDSEKDELGSFDVYVNCAGICLEPDLKGNFEEVKGKDGEVLSDEYREYLEETLDMETIFKVLEICAGMKLNDPNLLRAAMENLDGTN